MIAKWRNSHEIPSYGMYIMFRTDDNVADSGRIQDLKEFQVEILQGSNNKFYLNLNGVPIQEITSVDPECRFFGPLSPEEYEIARDLIMGLTGGLGKLIND